jgi:hypothetical protein
MVVRTLNLESDIIGPKRNNEQLLTSKYPYKGAIGALMYLANCTRPDIAFAVNALARSTNEPTKRHWAGVKQVFRYLAGTKTFGILYKRTKPSRLITDDLHGFADAGYLSDPHKARSQTGYVFLSAGGAIAWKSTKQTLVATSTNQAELIALYEACQECVWLRRLLTFVRNTLNIKGPLSATKLYEDNQACIAQVQRGYIKSDRTKHIDPKFFFMHELQGIELDILPIASNENSADIFTKSLGSSLHVKFQGAIGLCT